MATTMTKPEKKEKRKYRLLRGRHVEGSRAKGNQVVYEPGDLIETDADLLKFNGTGHNQQKFALASGDPYQDQINAMGGVDGDGLDMMNAEELKSVADNDGIDLAGCRNKQEIIRAIRSARNG